VSDETPLVRVGQVWADNDKRAAGRKVKVLRLSSVFEHPKLGRYQRDYSRKVAVPMAECEVVTERHAGSATGRHVRIRVERMKPTTTGYRLIQDAPEVQQ
jgi:hypothetical protein